MLNGLTIHHKGKSYNVDLTERDADHISDITAVLEYAPRDPGLDYRETVTQEQQAEHRKRFEEYEQASVDFQTPLKRIANLNQYQTSKLLAFLDLIELGELDGSQSNWALDFIEELLHDVIRYGPARALHQDPRGLLGSLSHYMSNYWQWVKDSREVVEQHPEIFAAKPAEPKVLPDTSVARTPRKRHSARKARRKAA